MDKISKMIQNAIISHCRMFDRPYTKHVNYAHRLMGNTCMANYDVIL